MRCEEVRAAISASLDGEAVVVDRAHVDGCEGCARFDAGTRRLRSALRLEVLDKAPDVSGAVRAAVAGVPAGRVRAAAVRAGRTRRLLPAVAAFVAGLLGGAALVWPARPGEGIAAADLPARVVAAQRHVTSLAADLSVVEAATGDVRTGALRYRAPDLLELRLGGTVLRTGDDRWRLDRADATVTARDGVEPFAGDHPVPLDLVLPAAGFAGAGPPVLLGEEPVGGRDAVGVRVPAAQVGALLSGLRPGGDGREVHPTDTVDLWLDRSHLVPLRVVVRAGAGPDRARWAAARGYPETAGAVVVEARLTRVAVNDARAVAGLVAPGGAGGAGAADGGFRRGEPDVPRPSWLPPGMAPHASGTVGDIGVRTWTDGRAWVKLRATTSWRGTRLFGGLGTVVRAVPVGDGVGYVAEDGSAVALHGDGVDLVVTGSVDRADLRRIAGSLGVTGLPVPGGWAEHATADLDRLGRTVPGHLVVPPGAWPGPPAVRLDDRSAVLVYAGPGDRAVVLASRADPVLSPPFDPDATGVVVRGRDGRWSPSRGELEWVERGRLWTLRSTTVGLPELVALAARLEPLP